jgi:alginate O-acetyltransferase complex protein AlgI
LFVSFFPQLIAGPIVHHKDMMPQYDRLRSKLINPRNVALGLFVFSIGLFKKVAIADQFAIWATNGFDNAEVLPLIEAWITSLSYTLQLYFDFSGYTDMAVGVAMLFNIRLPNNFNSPYKALDIQDFWRRWHITLSSFLKDYVYIPLGGNRSGNLRTHVNLMTTFILGGIWHGAGWTFIAWGALHGIALVIHRIWKQLGLKLHPLIAWFITFNFVNIAWVFFRAREWEDAYKVLKGMFGGYGLVLPAFFATHLKALSAWGVEFGGAISNVGGGLLTPVWVALCLLLVVSTPNSSHRLVAFVPSRRTSVFSGILFALGVLSLNNVSEFLYFDF